MSAIESAEGSCWVRHTSFPAPIDDVDLGGVALHRVAPLAEQLEQAVQVLGIGRDGDPASWASNRFSQVRIAAGVSPTGSMLSDSS